MLRLDRGRPASGFLGIGAGEVSDDHGASQQGRRARGGVRGARADAEDDDGRSGRGAAARLTQAGEVRSGLPQGGGDVWGARVQLPGPGFRRGGDALRPRDQFRLLAGLERLLRLLKLLLVLLERLVVPSLLEAGRVGRKRGGRLRRLDARRRRCR